MTFAGNDMSSVYRDVCRALIKHGDAAEARGQLTLELLNAQIQLYRPRRRLINFRAREMDMRYLVGELCFYLDSRTDLESIAHYSKFWRQVSDDDKEVNSAYGYRLFTRSPSQLNYALRCLEDDQDSRKAVMVIYDHTDARESRDNPCTMFLQLIIRNDFLHMFAHMRSNDLWLGTPYDVAFFTLVQEVAYVSLLRKYPRLGLGTYYHNATSLHAYEKDWPKLRALCTEGDHNEVRMPSVVLADVETWFDDLLTYEKWTRKKVLYKSESRRTHFQDWCKAQLK